MKSGVYVSISGVPPMSESLAGWASSEASEASGHTRPRARTCFLRTRAPDLFPVYAQEDASDASDEGRLMRVSGIGGTSDVLSIPPMSAMTKPLRAEMPETAAWIDALRGAFGAPTIDAAIKAGMDGQPTFYARENSREIGTRSNAGPGITLDKLYLQTQAEREDEAKRCGSARGRA